MSYSDEINYNQPPQNNSNDLHELQCKVCDHEFRATLNDCCPACGSYQINDFGFFDFEDNEKEFEYE